MTPEEKRRAYAAWKEKKKTKEKPQPTPPRPTPPTRRLAEPDLPPEIAEERRRNREKHPDIAAFVDDCRRYFGDVEVVSFEER